MDSKKVIQKLIKIAENQQKIINKLAQQIGTAPAPTPMGGGTDDWGNVTLSVNQLIEQNKLPCQAFNATVRQSDGVCSMTLAVSGTGSDALKQTVKNLLVGKTLKSKSGEQVAMPTDANKIQITLQANAPA